MGMTTSGHTSRVPRARRRTFLAFVLVLAMVGPLLHVLMSPPARAAVGCQGGSIYFSAHPDDDLIFMSPDLLHDVQENACVRTVYVTAGDAGLGEAYWRNREVGTRAAYAEMAGVANSWTASTV